MKEETAQHRQSAVSLQQIACQSMSKMHLQTVFVVSLVFAISDAVDLASPQVFNANFYISNNVEVLRAGIRDDVAARNHWLSTGINMGLQASGNFHSKQYIARYPDLQNAFGTNYQQAVQHYLTNGISEHRLGYVEGGYEDRWTVSDSSHALFVSASRRMGGAIDSLVWNNHEFINTWDHGRELQMAMNFVPNGECYNPTEAGGRDDSQLATTNTQIQTVHAGGTQITSTVHPAFWLRTGTHETQSTAGNCNAGSPALNSQNTYPYPFSKTVSLQCSGVTTPCLTYHSSFTIAGNIPSYTTLQMEAPTGYMTGDFTVSRSVDKNTGHLVAYNNRLPVVMSTPNDQFAMGVYVPPGQDTDEFQYIGTAHFPNSVKPAATNKWNVVFRKHTFATGSSHVLNYTAYICVGNVNQVVACINTLTRAHENIIG